MNAFGGTHSGHDGRGPIRRKTVRGLASRRQQRVAGFGHLPEFCLQPGLQRAATLGDGLTFGGVFRLERGDSGLGFEAELLAAGIEVRLESSQALEPMPLE